VRRRSYGEGTEKDEGKKGHQGNEEAESRARRKTETEARGEGQEADGEAEAEGKSSRQEKTETGSGLRDDEALRRTRRSAGHFTAVFRPGLAPRT
jgi:hypothetical protein